jgi:hypothetical protein
VLAFPYTRCDGLVLHELDPRATGPSLRRLHLLASKNEEHSQRVLPPTAGPMSRLLLVLAREDQHRSPREMFANRSPPVPPMGGRCRAGVATAQRPHVSLLSAALPAP